MQPQNLMTAIYKCSAERERDQDTEWESKEANMK